MSKIVQMVSHLGELWGLDDCGRLWKFRWEFGCGHGVWTLISEGPST